MRTRTIKCENENNISVIFGEKSDSAFVLEDADGLYQMDTKLSVSDNAMSDGGKYQSGWMKKRNIVLTLRDRGTDDHISNRNLLFTLFSLRAKGQLTITDSDINTAVKRTIDYYTESIDSDGTNASRTYTVSLICPDPFFYDVVVQKVQMAAWLPLFQFRHQFTSEKEELGYKSKERNQNIENYWGADDTGITITITTFGTVKNPVVARAESGERIKLGTDSKPLNLSVGDVITITTHSNNKHVYLTREGVRTEINQYLSADSVFLTLHRGDNTIGYDADAGVDMMSVDVAWRMRYTSA